MVSVGTFVLFFILEEMLSVFHHWKHNICCSLSYMTFIMLRWVPFMPIFWRVFYNKWVLNFVKSFLCICWDDHVLFIFQLLLIWCFTLIDLHILRNHCIPGINHTWSWHIVLLCVVGFCLLDLCCGFWIYVHQWYWPVIFFSCDIFVRFWYQGDGGLVEWVWEFFLSLKFEIVWGKVLAFL